MQFAAHESATRAAASFQCIGGSGGEGVGIAAARTSLCAATASSLGGPASIPLSGNGGVCIPPSGGKKKSQPASPPTTTSAAAAAYMGLHFRTSDIFD